MADNNDWFMREIRLTKEDKSEGYFFMINEHEEFDIDVKKWADYQVFFKVLPEAVDGNKVEFDVPSRNINLTMALGSHRADLEYIITEHMVPTLEVYGPQGEKKEEKKAKKTKKAASKE